MRAVGLLIVVLSLAVCTTARRLWTITHGTRGCSVTCDIFNGKCPYPSKCTDIYWLRRVQVNCFKRGGQLYQSHGEVWCGRETNPNWSHGIGRTPSPRRLSLFLARMNKVANEEEAVEHRRLRRSDARRLASFDDRFQVMEHRRLMSCLGLGHTRPLCIGFGPAACNCKCRRAYKTCFMAKTGHDCSNIRRTPVRVCNGERCIWDWKGYTPPKGRPMIRKIEGCKSAEVACKSRCTSRAPGPTSSSRRPTSRTPTPRPTSSRRPTSRRPTSRRPISGGISHASTSRHPPISGMLASRRSGFNFLRI